MEIKQLEQELLNSGKLDRLVEPIKSNLISLLENSLLCNCYSSKENFITSNELHIQFILQSILLNFIEGLGTISSRNPLSFNIPTDIDSIIFHKIRELFINGREEIIPQLYEKQLIMSFFDNKQLIFLANILSNINDISLSSLKVPIYKDYLIDYLEKDLGLVCLFDNDFQNNYSNLFYNQFLRYILNRVIYLNLYCSLKTKAILDSQGEMFLVNIINIVNLIVNSNGDGISNNDLKKTIIEMPTELLQ
ncbi:MAG: hypothetical protein V3575_06165 [Candidatus Absconditabacteria bacterium]